MVLIIQELISLFISNSPAPIILRAKLTIGVPLAGTPPVSRTLRSPSDFFVLQVKQFLPSTKSKTLTLLGFSDADWGNDLVDRRSTIGQCVYLGDNLVSWNSKKQHSVSKSSTESEYRSLTSVAVEII
ncbi:hypothetical protein UlMin_022498 [Ulmus minor]